MTPTTDFYMGTELECLTCVPECPDQVSMAIGKLLDQLAGLAPSIDGPSGLFNAYGRIYPDCGHIELAICECDSPYLVPILVERQQLLVREAAARVAAEDGIQLLIACNNHSGVLQRGCPVWGAHENHTVPIHPKEFTQDILPFLVTRIYGGAGGIVSPTGNYVAAGRALCMERAEGGQTTHNRAIQSTCREEHHMGRRPRRFRYHSIAGDGHRSQFNTALQFGTTALAIKAVCHDHQLKRDLAKTKRWARSDWVATLNHLNVLQEPGHDLRIQPLVIETQQIYLDAARRYVELLDEVPGWISRLLKDWEDTLSAMESLNRPWLAARLDTFAKYEFYSAILKDEGLSWSELPDHPEMFAELALLDHSYHDFCNDESVFSVLEQNGLLKHRVAPQVLPGDEPDPFVPDIPTRAKARARFIREHFADRDRYLMDWSRVIDWQESRTAGIVEPGAGEYSDWEEFTAPELRDYALWLAERRRRRVRPQTEEQSTEVPF